MTRVQFAKQAAKACDKQGRGVWRVIATDFEEGVVGVHRGQRTRMVTDVVDGPAMAVRRAALLEEIRNFFARREERAA